MKQFFDYKLPLQDVFLWFEETEVEFQDKLIVEKDWKWFLSEAQKIIEERAKRNLNLRIPDHLHFKDSLLVINDIQLNSYEDLFFLWHFVLYPRVVLEKASTILISPEKFNIKITIPHLPQGIDPILYKILKDRIESCRSDFFRIIIKGNPYHPLPMTEKESLLFQSMVKMGINPIPQYRISNEYNDYRYAYALDFAFENEKYYVECDDVSHISPERIRKDKERADILKGFGWKEIRFSNNEIGLNPDKCALNIKEIIDNRKTVESFESLNSADLSTTIDESLNRNQKLAAMHLSGPALVIAGPGTGKTKTMIERVAYLIHNGVSHNTIVVITFTKKAVDELTQRLVEKLGESAKKINISTIHSFCLNRILKPYYKISGKKMPNILTDEKIIISPLYKSLSRRYKTSLNIIEAIQFIDRLKTSFVSSSAFEENIDNVQFMQRFLSHWDISFGKNDVLFIAELYKQYDRIKRQNKQIDFGDIVGFAYKILSGEPRLRMEIQRKYAHILIDEFQDTGGYIYLILQAVAAPEDNLYVIGDDDQSIYGFRGAEPEVLLNFDMDYPNYNLYVLDINYRSSAAIIDYANKVIEKNIERFNKVIKPYNNSDGYVELRIFENEITEAAAIAEKIKKLSLETTTQKQSIAILLRTKSSALIIDEFRRRGISFSIKEKAESIYDRKGIRHIISYLKIAAYGMNKPCSDEWLNEKSGVLNVPNRYIGSNEFKTLLSEGKNFFRDFDLFVSAIGTHRQPQLNDLRNKIVEIRNSIQRQILLSHIIRKIRNVFGLDKYFFIRDYFGNPDERMIEDMNVFEMISDRFIFPHDLFIHIEDFNKFTDENKNKATSIVIDTLHKSKGLEYDTVFLPMLVDGYIPHKKNHDLEEERRLFYVGITRAKKNLYMSYSMQLFGRAINPSRFL